MMRCDVGMSELGSRFNVDSNSGPLAEVCAPVSIGHYFCVVFYPLQVGTSELSAKSFVSFMGNGHSNDHLR